MKQLIDFYPLFRAHFRTEKQTATTTSNQGSPGQIHWLPTFGTALLNTKVP